MLLSITVTTWRVGRSTPVDFVRGLGFAECVFAADWLPPQPSIVFSLCRIYRVYGNDQPECQTGTKSRPD